PTEPATALDWRLTLLDTSARAVPSWVFLMKGLVVVTDDTIILSVEWAKIKEDFPSMPWDEGSREVARKWKLIAPEEKQQWKDEADRERLKWEATPEGMAIMRGETPASTKTTKSTSATKRKRQQPHK
ncbi:hypothetical protein FOZ63_024273, partial [Perkinsus olseni]